MELNERQHILLNDYVEGELDARYRAEVQMMLAGDPALRELVEAMQRDREALRQLARDEAAASTSKRHVGSVRRRNKAFTVSANR